VGSRRCLVDAKKDDGVVDVDVKPEETSEVLRQGELEADVGNTMDSNAPLVKQESRLWQLRGKGTSLFRCR